MAERPGGSTQRAGQDGERAACRHLEQHGLQLLARNYRSPFGEIDLVMREGTELVFVEVRRRRSARFGTPAETVGADKQYRLRATAEHYLQHQPRGSQNPCRFDIVAITGEGHESRIEWLRNAF